MAQLVSVLVVLIGGAALAESSLISPDDRVVVRAAIAGCPDFPGVLTLRDLAESPKLDVLGLPPLKIIGLTEAEASQLLVEAISEATLTGHKPSSIVVEKVQSDEDYQREREVLLLSEHYLRTSDCVRRIPERDESDPGLLETMKSIALTHNNPMKRTSGQLRSAAYHRALGVTSEGYHD